MILKKIVSLFTAAALALSALFVCTVTASAKDADIKASVTISDDGIEAYIDLYGLTRKQYKSLINDGEHFYVSLACSGSVCGTSGAHRVDLMSYTSASLSSALMDLPDYEKPNRVFACCNTQSNFYSEQYGAAYISFEVLYGTTEDKSYGFRWTLDYTTADIKEFVDEMIKDPTWTAAFRAYESSGYYDLITIDGLGNSYTISNSGSSTVNPATTEAYVDGFWNTEGYYCLRLGNFGIWDVLSYMDDNSITASDLDGIYVKVKGDTFDDVLVKLSTTSASSTKLVVTPMVTAASDENNTDYVYNKSAIEGGKLYYNSANDHGLVLFLEKDSSMLSKLAACKSITILGELRVKNKSGSAYTIEEQTITPKFGGLEDYQATDISTLTFSKIGSKAYTGKALKPSVTVKDGKTKLVKGEDYTVTYKNNKKIGTATVTIKGIGSYTGEKTLTFKIVPKKTTLTAKDGGSKVTLSWKTSKGADGYEIYYSTSGGSYKKLTTAESGTLSKVVKITEGKTYKFKIRPYTTVSGKKVYGSWSKAVTVK